jgi:hypothetical protein
MPATGVAHHGAAGEAVGGLHGDGPHPVVTDLLGDLGGHLGRHAVHGDRELEGVVDLREPVGRELHVDHRSGDGDDATFFECGVSGRHGVSCSCPKWFTGGSADGACVATAQRELRERVGAEVVEEQVLGVTLVGRQGLGTADDLHDLGGDGVLAGLVHLALELDDELLGVVRGGLHRPLPVGVLGRRGVEERREQPALDVAGQQRLEHRSGDGSNSKGGAGAGRLGVAPSAGVGVEREEPAHDHLPGSPS